MAAPVRTIALRCPDWSIVAAEADPEMPIAVLRANRIIARTPAAAAEGVTLGLRRRAAHRRCPQLVFLPHDPNLDAEAFEPIVRAVGAFTPGLEVLEPGRLHLGARGPTRHFGGEEALALRLHEAAVAAALEIGPAARIALGIADGRFAADLAAHLAEAHDPTDPSPAGTAPAPTSTAGVGVGRAAGHPAHPDGTPAGVRVPIPGVLLVDVGATADFLRPQPVERLTRLGEVDDESVDLFQRLGLHRLGDLAALDPADVLARFGTIGLHAHQLAGGLDGRRPDAEPPPEPVEVAIDLDGPVDRLEPLVFAAKTLADELVDTLTVTGRTCSRLAVTAETDHGETDQRIWHRADGLDAAAMTERVRWQLAGWLGRGGDVGGDGGSPTAGIIRLHLEAVEVRGATGSQGALWGGTSELDERAARAVARLTTLVGDHAVLVPTWRGGRLPAERSGWTPAAAVDVLDRRETRRRLGPLVEPVGAPWPGSLPTPSPTVVLPEPEPAVLADLDGRPVRVTGRGELDGTPELFTVADRPPLLVVAWAGPWLVDERWWETARRRRLARLQILCENDTAHLVAVERRRWWLLASYR